MRKHNYWLFICVSNCTQDCREQIQLVVRAGPQNYSFGALTHSSTVDICDIKNAHLHWSFFSFNAIHLKICNNIELTIPLKSFVFRFSYFCIFGGKIRSQKFPSNFGLMGGMDFNDGFWKNSPQGCQKRKKFWNMLIHSEDIGFRKVQFSAILLLKNSTKCREIQISKRYIFWVNRHISKIVCEFPNKITQSPTYTTLIL